MKYIIAERRQRNEPIKITVAAAPMRPGVSAVKSEDIRFIDRYHGKYVYYLTKDVITRLRMMQEALQAQLIITIE